MLDTLICTMYNVHYVFSTYKYMRRLAYFDVLDLVAPNTEIMCPTTSINVYIIHGDKKGRDSCSSQPFSFSKRKCKDKHLAEMFGLQAILHRHIEMYAYDFNGCFSSFHFRLFKTTFFPEMERCARSRERNMKKKYFKLIYDQ